MLAGAAGASGRSLTIGWGGDIVPAFPAAGSQPAAVSFFARVRGILSTPGVRFGNLEGALTERDDAVLALDGSLSVSAVLTVSLRADGSFEAGRLVPIRLDRRGVPEPDPTEAVVPLARRLSLQDFGRSAARIAPTGSISAPGAG